MPGYVAPITRGREGRCPPRSPAPHSRDPHPSFCGARGCRGLGSLGQGPPGFRGCGGCGMWGVGFSHVTHGRFCAAARPHATWVQGHKATQGYGYKITLHAASKLRTLALSNSHEFKYTNPDTRISVRMLYTSCTRSALHRAKAPQARKHPPRSHKAPQSLRAYASPNKPIQVTMSAYTGTDSHASPKPHI